MSKDRFGKPSEVHIQVSGGPKPDISGWKRFFTPIRILGLGFILLAIAIAIVGFAHKYGNLSLDQNTGNFLNDFYSNISVDLASIAVVVLLIDYLNERRSLNELQQRLIRELSSRDSGIALRALEELRAHNCLYDGSLVGAILPSANLDHADMSSADLRGVMFSGANLQGAGFEFCNLSKANFWYANLQGVSVEAADLNGVDLRNANITDRELAIAKSLHCARLPNGRRYDGRYRLFGDIEMAVGQGYKPEHVQDMAKFYMVSESTYLEGQAWADENLEAILKSYDTSPWRNSPSTMSSQ